MSDFKKAKAYALDKVGPINLGAGQGDYICKVFAQTPEGHDVVISVTADNYEGYARALLAGSPAEVICDPSKILSLKLNMQTFNKGVPQATEEAIASVRARSVRTQ
jgi:hypothetical protein